MTSRRPLRINMQDVLNALTFRDDLILGWYLDLQTGQVHPLFDPSASGRSNEALEGAMDSDPGRFAKIPRYEREYRLMTEFTAGLDDDVAVDLDAALRGKEAFSRFRRVLLDHPDVGDLWQDARQGALVRWAVDWLHGLGVEPSYDLSLEPTADVELPDEGSAVGLLAVVALGARADEEGMVRRTYRAASERLARSAFERCARDLCDLLGIPRVRSRGELTLPGVSLRVEGAEVEVTFELDPDVISAF